LTKRITLTSSVKRGRPGGNRGGEEASCRRRPRSNVESVGRGGGERTERIGNQEAAGAKPVNTKIGSNAVGGHPRGGEKKGGAGGGWAVYVCEDRVGGGRWNVRKRGGGSKVKKQDGSGSRKIGGSIGRPKKKTADYFAKRNEKGGEVKSSSRAVVGKSIFDRGGPPGPAITGGVSERYLKGGEDRVKKRVCGR